MEDVSVNKRLEEAINALHMNKRAFSILVGIDNSNLSKKIKGTLRISEKDLNAISMNTNINVDWLRTGDGDMFLDKPVALYKKDGHGVPFYDIDFDLGFDDMYQIPEYVDSYIDVPGMNKATCWCRTTGNSMSPLINSGDLICLCEIDDWHSYVNNDDIYAIVAKNGLRTVKKVVETEDGRGWRLIPVNNEYHEQTVDKDNIYKVYHVIGTLKRL